jgi:hypothetical protein
MSRTPARVTQADINRSIRAAKQAGAGGVEIRPDGTIKLHMSAPDSAAGAATSSNRLHVYFIECAPFIKIGQTAHWKNRMGSLQTANPNPLKALALYSADLQKEKRLHQLFGEFRYRADGEWFHDCQTIRQYIEDHKSECRL